MHTHDMEDIDHGNVYYVFLFDVIEQLLKLVVVIVSESRLDWWSVGCHDSKVYVCIDWIKFLGLEVRICLSNCEGYDVLDRCHVIEVGCIDIPQPSDEH